ncbi:MAG TPA: DUF2723 domain-containing protein [Blastocatellia bacterium]|nr:DUF2723 domain-containing protein [Blastocatellia bacterium]
MTAGPADNHPISRIRVLCALTVFLASIVLYALTLAPTVVFVDSGELIVAARSVGVAHPPGFPLYVLLAHLATLVPIGNVAERVNFASALFGALACAALTLAVIEVLTTPQTPIDKAGKKLDRGRKRRKASTTNQASSDVPQNTRWLIVSSVTTGLLFAFSRTLWAYATIAEVYTLNSLLIATVVLLMFLWRRGVLEAKRSRPDSSGRRVASASPSDRYLYVAAFFFGLALGVHHVTVGLMLPALAVLALATEGIGFFRSRRLLYSALCAIAGLSIYAYLPLAASQSPIMNWGDPRTFEQFWWHVSGRQYQVFLEWSLKTMASQLAGFIKLVVTQFGPWWFPAAPGLAIAGAVAIYRRDKSLFWFIVLVVAADLVYCLGYEIAEDKDAYYLPSIIAGTMAAGFGAQWFIAKVIAWRRLESNLGRDLAVCFIAVVLIAALATNLPFNNRRGYFIAADYLDNIYSSIEPGGMLLTRDWQVYSPALYFREVEGRREDVVAIDINQLRRSWYFDYLKRAYPSTIEQARDKVDAFLEDLRQWEHDPDLYQRDVVLNRRISARFYDMILAFVSNHLRSAPVYVTLDIAANRDGEDAELTKSLTGSYQLVPQGLIFQATRQREFQQPTDRPLNTRGLAGGTTRFEDTDVVKQKVLPAYVTMLYNRGRYLAANGMHEQAIVAFKEALELQPGFSPAQQGINESVNARGKTGLR